MKQKPAVHEVERLLLDLVAQQVALLNLDPWLTFEEASVQIHRNDTPLRADPIA